MKKVILVLYVQCQCVILQERVRLESQNMKYGEDAKSSADNLAGNLAGNLDGVLTEKGHLFEARIYYADTDFSGFVYHARYLEFLERGRSDFLRLLGIQHHVLAQDDGVEPLVWVVRHMDIAFVAPARIDNIIAVETFCVSISGARIILDQTISLYGKTLIKARVEAALVNFEGKPRRFPKAWIALFGALSDEV